MLIVCYWVKSEVSPVSSFNLTDKRVIKKIEDSVIELYSLLHQRFVLSEEGLEVMVVLVEENDGDRRTRLVKECMVVVLVCCVKDVK